MGGGKGKRVVLWHSISKNNQTLITHCHIEISHIQLGDYHTQEAPCTLGEPSGGVSRGGTHRCRAKGVPQYLQVSKVRLRVSVPDFKE